VDSYQLILGQTDGDLRSGHTGIIPRTRWAYQVGRCDSSFSPPLRACARKAWLLWPGPSGDRDIQLPNHARSESRAVASRLVGANQAQLPRSPIMANVRVGDHLPSGSRPSFSLPARENIVVPGAASTRFALTRPANSSTSSTVSHASSASLISVPRRASARGAAHRAIEAGRGRGRRHLRTPA
jgi:hypothetical protein